MSVANSWQAEYRDINNLVDLAGATNLERFVPDADHINALLEPLRRYIHDLAARSCGRRGRNRIAEGEQQGGAVGERATSPLTTLMASIHGTVAAVTSGWPSPAGIPIQETNRQQRRMLL